jgi:hypothetical protein
LWKKEARPRNVPFYTWVREDTFAGWMNDDPVRHARGMKRAQEFVDENPNHAEAINWLGTGKIFEATSAYAAGDQAKGDALYQAGFAEMEKAVTNDSRLVCQSCHEPGRLQSWMARQPSL